MIYSAAQMARKLDISRSYLYYLKNSGVIEVETDKDGKTLWTDSTYRFLSQSIKKNHKDEEIQCSKGYKTVKINNRRYLGNKYKLVPFIKDVVDKYCKNVHTVADIFAGTGAVASAFTANKLITNDILYSNYICHVAWFGAESYSEEKIIRQINKYNSIDVKQDNYMSLNFANTYFSLDDCRKIGFIRQDIEDQYISGEINGRERALLITALLYAMDKIANTCGHYDAYRKGGTFEKHLELSVPEPDCHTNPNNICYNMDTNELVKEIEADLVYIDPPYNSRQYCDAYHLLENVARWDKPQVFGVAKKMDRTKLKSDYCTQKAAAVFENLINSINARYILLSYNNMAEKGNDRSNAKICDDDIMRILRKKGSVRVFTSGYKAFTAGKSKIKDHQERLFLCECNDQEKQIIQSPLNYTGGKYKLLPQMMPYFPKDADEIIDLFCGGCNVGINLNCNKVRFNDSNPYLMGLLNAFRRIPKQEIFDRIFRMIDKYRLSLVCQNGYVYYGCESSAGLGEYNKEGYNRLRRDFNDRAEHDDEYYLMLYLLVVYSFNNQIRFNRKGEFNLPVGKRDFNHKMQEKLGKFLDRIKAGDYSFTNMDFRDISPEAYTDKSFFYVDPPYLVACASYNERDGWTEADEIDLLSYLDRLDRHGVRFALSNVLENKGRKNTILSSWIEKHEKKMKVIPLDYSYSNANYHTMRDGITKEVLVINY